MLIGRRDMERTGGHMNEIDLTVKQLRKLDLILQRQAALNDLRTL